VDQRLSLGDADRGVTTREIYIRKPVRQKTGVGQDGVEIDVAGLDEFDIDEFGGELDDAKKLLDLGIGSETLKKEVFKRLALKYLSDARQEVKNAVVGEIELAGETQARD